MIELRTLGAVDLLAQDGRLLRPVLAQPKRLALLIYLALRNHRGQRRRDSVVALFWPECDTDHARGALRQALRFLRLTLGPGVVNGHREEELGVEGSALWCDAVAFEDAIAAGRLAEGWELYRGDFLEGFFVSGASVEFDRWIEAERTRLRALALHAAQTLAERAEVDGNAPTAVQWAHRALALSRDDEVALRQLIALLDRQGDRAGAVGAYEDFARRLAEDHGIEPSAETKQFIEAVRARDTPARTIPITVSAMPSGAPVERSDHLAASPAAVAPRHLRLSKFGPVAFVGIGALSLAVYLAPAAQERRARLDPERVVVAVFDNQTGDPALGPLGEIAADWTTQGLLETGLVEVVDARVEAGDAALTRGRGAAGIRALAEATGAGAVVWGHYYRQADSVVFQAQVTDARSARTLRVLEPRSAPIAAPLGAIAQLRERVMAGLATLVDVRAGPWTNLTSPPPKYEAYLEFVAGQDARWRRIDRRAALAHFRRAALLDTSYTAAKIWAAGMHLWLGECAQTDSIAGRLPSRERLPAAERYLLEMIVAGCGGDPDAAYRAARLRADHASGSVYDAFQAASWALNVNRPQESLDQLERLDPDRGWLRGQAVYWSALTTGYHLVQDHRRELRAATRGRRAYPDKLRSVLLEIRALAAQGREDDVLSRVDESLKLSPEPQLSNADVLLTAALELRAHGHPPAAGQVVDRALEWLARRPRAEQAQEAHRFARGRLLYASERWSEAEEVFATLAAERPESVTYRGYLGALAARQADAPRAIQIAGILGDITIPYLRGEHTLWRARIAAVLGEPEEALALLQKAFEEGVQFGHGVLHEPWLHADPDLEVLRGLPGFREILRPKG